MPITLELQEIRSKAIELLEKLYKLTSDVPKQKQILNVLQEVSRTPSQGGYKDDMEEMVLSDTNKLIQFYISIVQNADVLILKVIEDHLGWFKRRFEKKGIKDIDKLITLLAINKDYEFFKVFVGHDFEEQLALGYEEADKLRKEKVDEFVKNLSDTNKKEWVKRIIDIAEHYLVDDPSSFQYFNIFLEKLGKEKTEFALELINQHDVQLKFFLVYLLGGVWKKDPQKVKQILLSWVKDNKNLEVASVIFGNIEEIDLSVLESIFTKAKKEKNIQVLENIVYSIWRVYSKNNEGKDLFIKVVKELTKFSDPNWINHVWYHKEKPILDDLSETDVEVILKNLLLMPTFNHYLEQILDFVAKKYPKKLIEFFADRVERKEKIDREKGRYEDIPFRVSRLDEYLKENEKVVLSEIFKWFEKAKSWPWEWKASHLLQALFPGFPKILQEKLISLIKIKKKKYIHRILSILRAYNEVIPYDVCKEFIKVYGNKKEYRNEMFTVLSQTGVVSGEYGFVEAYKHKKSDIQHWKKEQNKKISAFVKEYEDYLDGQIVYEKRKANEGIELRKRGIQ